MSKSKPQKMQRERESETNCRADLKSPVITGNREDPPPSASASLFCKSRVLERRDGAAMRVGESVEQSGVLVLVCGPPPPWLIFVLRAILTAF